MHSVKIDHDLCESTGCCSMVCPEDGEEFSGDFKFCPRHSVELVASTP